MKNHLNPVILGFLTAAAIATALSVFLGSGWGQPIVKNRDVSQPGLKKDVASNDHADSDMR
jgi:hypothetical protein